MDELLGLLEVLEGRVLLKGASYPDQSLTVSTVDQPFLNSGDNFMKKAIVTTTINSPTAALRRYSELSDWTLIVVGDVSTPHHEYESLDCVYLSPEQQESLNPALSKALGWRSITRRNFGFIEAYRMGAEVVATVDDDNCPTNDWGSDLLLGRTVAANQFDADKPVIDPLAIAPHDCGETVWHRGFPFEYLKDRFKLSGPVRVEQEFLVQASLWNGSPDVDAICRMVHDPEIRFKPFEPFCARKLAPFNSQNTFLSRKVLPYYMMLTDVGRAQDILGSYLLQHHFPGCVVFTEPSVVHARNQHNLHRDLESELVQYRISKELVENLRQWRQLLPPASVENFDRYQQCFS